MQAVWVRYAPDLAPARALEWTRHLLTGGGLKEEDFAWVTEKLVEIAEKHAGGRVVSTLEGGYNLQALARSTAAHPSNSSGSGRA